MTATYDESGAHKTQYAYANGGLKEEILPNGGKFAYGYDQDGRVTAISQSTEAGEGNSTQRIYRFGELVQLTAESTKMQYAYDSARRVKKVDLNGITDYLTYTYTDVYGSTGELMRKTVTAQNYIGAQSVTERDGNGNLLQWTWGGTLQMSATYDKKNVMETLQDKITGKNYQYVMDDGWGQLSEMYETDADGVQVTDGYAESYTYDGYGAVMKKTLSGAVNQVYTYTYKTDKAHTLDSVAVQINHAAGTTNKVTFYPKTDKLGRNVGREIHTMDSIRASESITYKKVGDHATCLPSTIRYLESASGYFEKDQISYEYDTMGNISKVYYNGEIARRYTYDKVNRLIREDNKTLDKTVMVVYDNNGNIVRQREFAFTLKDETAIEELESTDLVYEYNGDKLMKVGEESAFMYNAWGNHVVTDKRNIKKIKNCG